MKIRLVPSCSSPFHVFSALGSLLISPRLRPCLPTLIPKPASLLVTYLGPFLSCGALMAWVSLGGKHSKLSETYIYHPNSQASPFFFLLLPAPNSHRRAIRTCEAWNSWVSRGTLKDNEEKETEGLRAGTPPGRALLRLAATAKLHNKQIPWARTSTPSSAQTFCVTLAKPVLSLNPRNPPPLGGFTQGMFKQCEGHVGVGAPQPHCFL